MYVVVGVGKMTRGVGKCVVGWWWLCRGGLTITRGCGRYKMVSTYHLVGCCGGPDGVGDGLGSGYGVGDGCGIFCCVVDGVGV